MIAPWRNYRKPYSGSLNPRSFGLALLAAGLLFGFAVTSRHPVVPGGRPVSALVKTIAQDATPPRKVFPLSVIHGGAYSQPELDRARRTDTVVAAHYSDFGPGPKFEKLSRDMLMYVSYRRGNQVYWSKSKHRIAKGETVISDGNCMARARCGNRLSTTAKGPVAPKEPTEEVLNTPEAPEEPVGYSLADLPGPQGRPFAFVLPTDFAEATSSPSSTPVAVPAGPLASGPLTTSVPGGPGAGFAGVGAGPLTSSGNAPVSSTATSPSQTTVGVPSSPTSGTTTPVTGTSLPTSTTSGTSLPTSPVFPGSGTGTSTVPVATPSELVPEPAAFGYGSLAATLIGIWLVRRSRSRFLRG